MADVKDPLVYKPTFKILPPNTNFFGLAELGAFLIAKLDEAQGKRQRLALKMRIGIITAKMPPARSGGLTGMRIATYARGSC